MELAALGVGDKVSATSVAWPGRTFEGVVSTIDARIDPATRAVTVRGDFANSDHALRPGMLLDVRLFRPERPALVVPESPWCRWAATRSCTASRATTASSAWTW